MNKRVAKIIEECRYEEDPNWDILKLMFRMVSFDNLQRILERRDTVISQKLKLKKREKSVYKPKRGITDFNQLKGVAEITPNGIRFLWPTFFSKIVTLPFERFFINQCDPGVFIDAGVVLRDVLIDAPTFIDKGALIEYTKIQAPERCNFIGEDVTISNVYEIRGCFISGGQFASTYKGRTKTYMHPASMNNMIVGAGAGMSGGTNIHNHPQAGIPSAVFDLSKKEPWTHRFPEKEKHFKMPIFIGVGSGVGINCSIHSGSIIGAHCVVLGNSVIEGYAIRKNGKVVCDKFNR